MIDIVHGQCFCYSLMYIAPPEDMYSEFSTPAVLSRPLPVCMLYVAKIVLRETWLVFLRIPHIFTYSFYRVLIPLTTLATSLPKLVLIQPITVSRYASPPSFSDVFLPLAPPPPPPLPLKSMPVVVLSCDDIPKMQTKMRRKSCDQLLFFLSLLCFI